MPKTLDFNVCGCFTVVLLTQGVVQIKDFLRNIGSGFVSFGLEFRDTLGNLGLTLLDVLPRLPPQTRVRSLMIPTQ